MITAKKSSIEQMKLLIDAELKVIAKYPNNKDLEQAIEYALFPGKRLRSTLLLSCIESFGLEITPRAVKAAAAIEAVHAFSLIHDDMPALDNAETRRGQPSFFKKYGEANAILVGDLLQNLAKQHISNEPELLKLLINYTGYNGMIMGQWLETNSKILSLDQLHKIQDLKTGQLFAVAGAIADAIIYAELKSNPKTEAFCMIIGRCLQWQDDLYDAQEDAEGTNIVHHIGIEATHIAIEKSCTKAIELIKNWPKAAIMRSWLDFFLDH